MRARHPIRAARPFALCPIVSPELGGEVPPRRLSDFAVFRMKTLSETIAAAQPRARADEPLRPC
ncbi:hypothetical protein THIX_20003 [Thiomonas sp. X19]|nr:hypothetical protein THIX_20003 [Thiomonas sp. X19]